MIKYITTRPLWFNILVAIGILVILTLIFVLSLNWITRHGEAKTVPAVTGKNINDVQTLLSNAGFETVIQDSVYYDSLPRGIVVKQVPEADQVVKVNRTVYVVINRFVAPDISMPNLVGYTFRNAEMTLNNLGLKMGDTISKPDFAKYSVLEMRFNGNPIKAGDKVKIGSTIDLVVGSGLGNEDMVVPELVGLPFADAKSIIDADGLVLGSIMTNPDVKDIQSAYVFWQNPPTKTGDGTRIRIRPGQMIDLKLSMNPPAVDSTTHPPPPTPEQQKP
ncbi:MAG: PASTA domain-containing protein [Flavisolibacter sp.]|jgi:beta-lactam-binding protein with PASTA domain